MKRASYRKSIVSMHGATDDMEDLKFITYKMLDDAVCPESPLMETTRETDEQWFTLDLRALNAKVTSVFFLVRFGSPAHIRCCSRARSPLRSSSLWLWLVGRIGHEALFSRQGLAVAVDRQRTQEDAVPLRSRQATESS